MELEVLKITGEKTGRTIQLDDSIFGIKPNDHAIYLDVKQILANRRQGTHKTKHRGEVSGSTRKIKRQKGTGGARAGSIKNPLFRGGGRVFGPQPRDYSLKLNKKLKRLARRSALSYKAGAGRILVVEDFVMERPKTRDFVSILKSLQLDNSRVLLVTRETDRNTILSSRNLQEVHCLEARNLNTYEIMKAGHLVMTESSIEEIHNLLAN